MKWTRLNIPSVSHIYDTLVHTDNEYHNIVHINAMYDYLERTKEPYHFALDLAVLFHDIVYDSKPEKEERSLAVFMEWAENNNIPREIKRQTRNMILATKNHLVTSEEVSAIVRADLHTLADPMSTIYNYVLIHDESKNLYGLNDRAIAIHRISFMKKLLNTVLANATRYDPEHSGLYFKIADGIRTTLFLSDKLV